jgi:tripartite-type tricarboxylate transporter receptor subunit TctC
MGRRSIGVLVVLVSMLGAAHGQTFPVKPIRMVVPFPAGGGSDSTARNLAPRLSERLKQQVIVDNRPGAAGAIGTEYASRAAPDGYTLLLGSTSELALYPALVIKPAYDTLRDFVPVALISDIPFLLVVHPSLPAHSIKALVGLAKKRPGEINYGSAGAGATSHLTMALFCTMTGTQMVHIPYKGSPLAAADLLGGHLHVMMPPMPSVLAYANSGRLRALAVSSAKRWPTVPDLPTVAESGITGYEVVLWTGVLAPTNTPQDIVARLYREIAQVVAVPEVVQGFASQGAVINVQGPEQFGSYMKSEIGKWARIGRQTGLSMN